MNVGVATTLSFYEQIPAFTRFAELTEESHYRELPGDWVVIITDVQGSTRAIEENRYKDVNLLGASSIVAVLNELKGRSIPFVFGGDGATLLVHESDLPKIRGALLGSQKLAQDVFGLNLRTGAVPMAAIKAAGGVVRVARFLISPTATIAMLQGRGLSLAESWIKTEGSRYLTQADPGEDAVANFDGLSCRWNPIDAHKGEMMSLLVRATGSAVESKATYESLLRAIDEILGTQGNHAEAHPLSVDRIERKVSVSSILKEMRLQTMGRSLAEKWGVFTKILIQVCFMKVAMATGWRLGNFTASGYIKDMIANSDFQKFDDMLRMVRDVSAKEKAALLKMLEEKRRAGAIQYGVHFSNQAMLTCLVFQLDNHIHFVDGGSGGYAIAAKQLKSQLKASQTTSAS